MAAGGGPDARIAGAGVEGFYLDKFKLYQTQSKFYIFGREKSKLLWKVLKIDRLEPFELNIHEDLTTYSESQCRDLLQRLHEGNRSTGGLVFVTGFYGIIGFVKFLGPYYMLLITERRKLGSICGHEVYAVAKSEMIPLSNYTVWSNMVNSKVENRYKKLLGTVDLTKDFFFSYSYNIMHSLQRNVCDYQTGPALYETMFVWNEFLTRRIRNHLKNTLWTVALVFGFFHQAVLSASGKDCELTLIARRSRHFAGTRYLKRGVNEKGRVANDVETEQVVSEYTPKEFPARISSVVQNRGSIPLFWSQEASWRNFKPDIILLKKDQNYEATRLHFENLVNRYGNPIVISNLIKTCERKPREAKLRVEFAEAINQINNDLPEADRLRFLHWDIQKYCRKRGTKVLELLGEVAVHALNLTGFFYCQLTPTLSFHGGTMCPIFGKDDAGDFSCNSEDDSSRESRDKTEDGGCFVEPLMLQKGVLRTNCIDCLDRTNVAQYAYGLVALGYQLQALGILDTPKIDLKDPLAESLMMLYEQMGDTLALQYGGSAAHNKIFSERRGQWKAATQSQELFRIFQRYFTNTYMDTEKQDAINLFLGHFQPQLGKPELWELDSDQHYNVGRHDHDFIDERARLNIKRSLSDGSMICENEIPISMHQTGETETFADTAPKLSNCDDSLSFSRNDPMIPVRQFFAENMCGAYLNKQGSDVSDCSNFLNFEWLSSTGNSREDLFERTSLGDDIEQIPEAEDEPHTNGEEAEGAQISCDVSNHSTDVVNIFSESFVQWVAEGDNCFTLI
ncbi:phosphoinositide phosphatase SAC2-like isoform X2 [Dioscorea cayenensis subsp. rotundata]|uniref:Phosphoinositide phosphatase SAC2-like isoform X2 n=1 Tax=Dioscorea cayennensis subsp. rotundata TaxID=55577 RepID=A0AB40BEA0_DIOCR|nr:phosphoinositide phosphatase SAC2-like isoform X2 [Dioscorea cayenensis subsp. rotundata]